MTAREYWTVSLVMFWSLHYQHLRGVFWKVYLRFEPGAAGWVEQMPPMSYRQAVKAFFTASIIVTIKISLLAPTKYPFMMQICYGFLKCGLCSVYDLTWLRHIARIYSRPFWVHENFIQLRSKQGRRLFSRICGKKFRQLILDVMWWLHLILLSHSHTLPLFITLFHSLSPHLQLSYFISLPLSQYLNFLFLFLICTKSAYL